MHPLGLVPHHLTALTRASGQRGAAAPAAHSTSWQRFHPLSSPLQRLLKLVQLLQLLRYGVINCVLSPTAHICFQHHRPLPWPFPRPLLRPHRMPLRLKKVQRPSAELMPVCIPLAIPTSVLIFHKPLLDPPVRGQYIAHMDLDSPVQVSDYCSR